MQASPVYATSWISLILLVAVVLLAVLGVVLLIMALRRPKEHARPTAAPAPPRSIPPEERGEILRALAEKRISREEAERRLAVPPVSPPAPPSTAAPGRSGAGCGCLAATLIAVAVLGLLLLLVLFIGIRIA